jgi:hypothetical protein
MAANYNKKQSTIIALWVLAIKNTGHPEKPIKNGTAPNVIRELVNSLGEKHSSDSILSHTHGYDQLLLNRQIEKTITSLQREVSNDLLQADIVNQIFG